MFEKLLKINDEINQLYEKEQHCYRVALLGNPNVGKVPYLIIYVKCTSIQETGLEKRLLLPKENTIVKIAVMSL